MRNHEKTPMSVDALIFILAAVTVVVSIALAALHNVYWAWLGIFMMANLARGAASGDCPLARFFQRLGARPGPTFS